MAATEINIFPINTRIAFVAANIERLGRNSLEGKERLVQQGFSEDEISEARIYLIKQLILKGSGETGLLLLSFSPDEIIQAVSDLRDFMTVQNFIQRGFSRETIEAARTQTARLVFPNPPFSDDGLTQTPAHSPKKASDFFDTETTPEKEKKQLYKPADESADSSPPPYDLVHKPLKPEDDELVAAYRIHRLYSTVRANPHYQLLLKENLDENAEQTLLRIRELCGSYVEPDPSSRIPLCTERQRLLFQAIEFELDQTNHMTPATPSTAPNSSAPLTPSASPLPFDTKLLQYQMAREAQSAEERLQVCADRIAKLVAYIQSDPTHFNKFRRGHDRTDQETLDRIQTVCKSYVDSPTLRPTNGFSQEEILVSIIEQEMLQRSKQPVNRKLLFQ